ncbi:MAG: sugar nucleotide-binding protein [Bacillota bacterium]|nr:sugar nucleotide-binding protein [Bacillota bacterium]
MKKILITGGKGYFASRFSLHYKDKYEILAIDKDQLDIRDENKTIELMKDFKPNYVIHAAAIAVTDFCNEHPDIAHDINVKGALNVAKGCEMTNSKLIFLSSEQVFNGNTESGPYTEDHTALPDTVYGQNKLEVEGKLKEIFNDYWIVRFTWLFGLPDKGLPVNANIMWNTVQTILTGKKEKVPANEYRGMAYGYDVIEKFDKIFNLPFGTYHVGSENDMSRYEVVKFIFKEMGLENRLDEFIIKDTEKYKVNPRDVRLSTAKIRNLGVNFLNTEEAIKKCIKDYSLNFSK